MTFEQRHYAQLVLLEKLADDAGSRHRRIARKLRAGLLIAMGLACLIVVAWLVHTAVAAFYPISLGAIAGAMLAGGVIELLYIGNDEEPSSWSSDPA